MYKSLKRGETVYTILRHVSRSGMFRVIDLYVIRKNTPVRVACLETSKPDDAKYDNERMGYKVTGCGMDMGFHLVHNLSIQLFKDGYALKHEWL